MKKQKLSNKLTLGKTTIANADHLDAEAAAKVKGGETYPDCFEPTLVHKTCHTCNSCYYTCGYLSCVICW